MVINVPKDFNAKSKKSLPLMVCLALKMKELHSFEILIPVYQNTHCNISQDFSNCC